MKILRNLHFNYNQAKSNQLKVLCFQIEHHSDIISTADIYKERCSSFHLTLQRRCRTNPLRQLT